MSNRNNAAIVLFSGPGGSCTGLRNAGIDNIAALEWEESAVATSRAAGHTTFLGDVRLVDPYMFAKHYGMTTPGIDLLLQSSPPCQGLSLAGKGAGREDLIHLFAAIETLSALTDIEALAVIPGLIEELGEKCSDERSPLTFETLRWIARLNPAYIMLEQVPAALPIWDAIATLLEAWNYSTWTGNVQAEQFGVPQTRKRAILMASRVSEIAAPVPTHSKYHNRTPAKLDDGVAPWVSMAEALTWGMTHRPYPTVAAGTGGGGGTDPQAIGGSGARKAIDAERADGRWIEKWWDDRPGKTHMGDARNAHGCIRQVNEPAPTMTSSMDNGNFQWIDYEQVEAKVQERINNQSGTKFDLAWPAKRPAPTVAGREIVTMPGANANRFNGSTKSRNDGVRVLVEEAGVLQSFDYDYPWQGTKTQQFQQVGNAVPPLLQQRLTESLLGLRVSVSLFSDDAISA